jgi:NAD(P)-dependent dehydrogenase (short-subunit alcohol dehydrogenase family)
LYDGRNYRWFTGEILMTTQGLAVQTAVVTGASTGIGEACALHLDGLGFQVFAGVRNQVDSETLQRQASARLRPIFIDVTKVDTIELAARSVAAEVGIAGLSGLVNNAGIVVGGPLEFLPLAELRKQFEVNVIGQIAVTQAFLSLLRQGRGRVVNMSSLNGRVAMPFVGPYAASKFGLEALTDALRVELNPWGIEVISIQPGAIATPIWHKSVAHAEEVSRGFPAEAEQLYGAPLDAVRRRTVQREQNGLPPQEVARVVARALTAKRPKTRYLVGREVRVLAILVKFLPDRVRDWFIRQALR